MKEKLTPHIIAVTALVVFIVLGLACASSESAQKSAPEKNQEPSMSAEEYFNRGKKYLGNNNIDPAFADFTQAVKLDPNNASYNAAYYFTRGRINERRSYGDMPISRKEAFLNQAGDDFAKAIELDPGNAFYWNGFGGYHKIHTRLYDLAAMYYSVAIMDEPNNITFLLSRADLYLQYTGQYDLAIADLNEIIRLSPKGARYVGNYYDMRGRAYYNLRNYDKAVADHEEAVRLDPNDTRYQSNLQRARQALGR